MKEQKLEKQISKLLKKHGIRDFLLAMAKHWPSKEEIAGTDPQAGYRKLIEKRKKGKK